MNTFKFIFILIFTYQTNLCLAQVRLPKLISDGMVLQRDHILPIWGWASPNENITIFFQNKTYKTKASKTGNWQIELPKMRAGGPYDIKISGKNDIQVKDILIGDVWLCSGQSNMVHQLDIHDVTYAHEIANANYPEIRHFKIPTSTSISGEKNDLEGGSWQKAIGEQVRPFSAISYFFAKKIYDKHHIPIGLINASVGGTPIEAWIPEHGFKKFPEILNIINENKDPEFINKQSSNFSNNSSTNLIDKGLIGDKKWYEIDFEPKKWRTINIPGYWEDQGIDNLDGIVWYRKNIEIPDAMIGKPAKVFFGRIVDADELYINGKKVGNTGYQYPQRRYPIPSDILKPGKNTFVIRVTNNGGKGGFISDKPYYIFTENDTLDLKGYWSYKVGAVFKPKKIERNKNSVRRLIPQNEPAALYNAMIAPYTKLPLKGILWYQGESNTGQPEKYQNYMEALINSWRIEFENVTIPFIYAQLPNFMDVSYLPSESNWAELRNAQLKTLALPNTAMTVNIDLGEWNDIHPDNKKDVGERMALAGLKLAYNEDLEHSGPIYKAYKIENNKIIISFTHIGKGLTTIDDEELSEFAIAGEDKQFVWAKAKIEDNKVIVWDDEIKTPRYLRYAWANNPDNPNLYNKDGLPASPFEIEIK